MAHSLNSGQLQINAVLRVAIAGGSPDVVDTTRAQLGNLLLQVVIQFRGLQPDRLR